MATLNALKAGCGGLTGLRRLPKGFGKRLEKFEGWQLAPLNAVKAECGGLKSAVRWLDWVVDAAKGFGKRLESFEGWQLATLNALKAECGGLTGSRRHIGNFAYKYIL